MIWLFWIYLLQFRVQRGLDWPKWGQCPLILAPALDGGHHGRPCQYQPPPLAYYQFWPQVGGTGASGGDVYFCQCQPGVAGPINRKQKYAHCCLEVPGSFHSKPSGSWPATFTVSCQSPVQNHPVSFLPPMPTKYYGRWCVLKIPLIDGHISFFT